MSLKIEDIKPGDILCYNNEWYILVVQDHKGTPAQNLDYVWISGNSHESMYESAAWRKRTENTYKTLSFPGMLKQCNKVTHLSNKILIGELKKIDNRT